MKVLLTILVSALAAFAGTLVSRTDEPSASGPDPALGSLRAEAQALRLANQRLTRELEQQRSGLLSVAPAPDEGIGEAEIGAALARWRAANPLQAKAVAERRVAPLADPLLGEVDLASTPMPELVAALFRAGFGNQERQEIFQKLRELGRIDEYVAAIEALAAADPDNPDLQVALGHAYLQKLFGVGNAPEAGPLAFKSDAAFDRALELDGENWGARFSKAVALSNWPAFMGRGPEAIEHFEILLEQQQALPQRPEFATTYLLLGNVQQASGDHDGAVATWRAGLTLFPEVSDLRSALELAESSGKRDGQR